MIKIYFTEEEVEYLQDMNNFYLDSPQDEEDGGKEGIHDREVYLSIDRKLKGEV